MDILFIRTKSWMLESLAVLARVILWSWWHIHTLLGESAENLISALLNSKWEEENELFSFPLLLRYTTTTTNAIAKLFSPFFFFIPFPLENICIRISMYICSSWRRLLYIQENSTKISNWKMAHSYFFLFLEEKQPSNYNFQISITCKWHDGFFWGEK